MDKHILSKLAGCCIALFALLQFSSCRTYNFTHPLPADRANVYEFPSSWHGSWMNADSQGLVIGRNYVAVVIRESTNVVRGVWPQKNEEGKYVFPNGINTMGMYRVKMDSLDNPLDTIANYIIHQGHIYAVNYEKRLDRGHTFTIDKDTFRVNMDDTIWVDLGRNAFLRELKKDMYILNILDQVVGMQGRWWQIGVLEKTGSNSMERWDCSSKMTTDSTMFYSMKDDYYFNSHWNAAEMIQLIRNGSFEKSDPFQRSPVKP